MKKASIIIPTKNAGSIFKEVLEKLIVQKNVENRISYGLTNVF